MRRFLMATGVLLPVLFLSACAAKSVADKRPALNFKSDLEIYSSKATLSAKIIRNEADTQIEITSPESLNRLKISHGSDENSISKDGLAYKTDKLILPSDSDIAAIFEVLDFMAENSGEEPFFTDNTEIAFIGKVDAGKFELRADRKTGLITEIKIGDKSTIKFSNQEKL